MKDAYNDYKKYTRGQGYNSTLSTANSRLSSAKSHANNKDNVAGQTLNRAIKNGQTVKSSSKKSKMGY